MKRHDKGPSPQRRASGSETGQETRSLTPPRCGIAAVDEWAGPGPVRLAPPPTAIQAKLSVGAPGGRLEREAERVSRLVADRPGATPPAIAAATSEAPGPEARPWLASKVAAAKGEGRPLDWAERAPMERALAADFSAVRVHDDARAGRLSRALGARAFTTGRDIFVGAGEYRPHTRDGNELLAHELTHVVQQGGGTGGGPPLVVSIAQCETAWTKQHVDEELDEFLDELDDLVNANADLVLRSPLAIPDTDGYVARWKVVIDSFAGEFKELGGLEAAKAAEPFVYTTYGYAVESLTNQNIQSGKLSKYLPEGAEIATQSNRGPTRPDIIVRFEDDEEELLYDAGWFDITASASKLHIHNKSGAGWKNTPYVAEVTYPSLNDKSLGTMASAALMNAGVDAKKLKELKRQVAEHKKWVQSRRKWAYNLIKDAIDQVGDETNMARRRNAFETGLGELLEQEKLTPKEAKGWIALVWRVGEDSAAKLFKAAGYGPKESKGPDTEAAKRAIFNLEEDEESVIDEESSDEENEEEIDEEVEHEEDVEEEEIDEEVEHEEDVEEMEVEDDYKKEIRKKYR